MSTTRYSSGITYPASTLPNLTISYDGYERPVSVNNGTTITNVGYTSTGSLVSSDLYDGFGSATSTGTPTDPFGYGGRFGYYTEHGTSLILCGHRFYDSSTGRFITRDPIGYAGGINLYGYVGNNSVNAIDPSGFATFGIKTGGEAGVGLGPIFGVFVGGNVSAQFDTSGNIAVGYGTEGGISAETKGEIGLHGGGTDAFTISPGNMDNPNIGSETIAGTGFSSTEETKSYVLSGGPYQGGIEVPNSGGAPTFSLGDGPRGGLGLSVGMPGENHTFGFNPVAPLVGPISGFLGNLNDGIERGISNLYPPSPSDSPVPFLGDPGVPFSGGPGGQSPAPGGGCR